MIDGTSTTHGQQLDLRNGEVSFENVSFCYPSRPSVQVLDNVSFNIPASRHTAIVGLSGSGKSTIASLIERLYDPSYGAIFLDGQDVKSLRVSDVRACIGLVEQESTLFNRSILENVAYGLTNSPDQRHALLQPVLLDGSLSRLVATSRSSHSFLENLNLQEPRVKEVVRLVSAALDLANAAFVEHLENGLATSVGPLGCQLSGGQRQRVALARALVREPRILILDEATASLDSESEHKILDSIANVIEKCTVVSIAHRLSTICSANNIVVMRNGCVVEQGNHAELLDLGGDYAGMVRLQSLKSLNTANSSSTTIAAGNDDQKLKSGGQSLLGSDRTSMKKSELTNKIQRNIEKLEYSSNTREPTGPRSLKSTCIGICSLVRPQLLFIMFGLLASTVVGSSYSGEAVLFGHTVGALSSCNTSDAIRNGGSLLALLFFILAIGEFVANIMGGSSFGWIAEKLLFRIRSRALRSLLHQDIHWHESEGRTPGILLSQFTSDTSALGSLAGTTVSIVFSIIVNLVAGIVLSHIVAWKIAIVLLAVIPVLLGSGFMRLHVLNQFQERHRKAFAFSVSLTIEAVNSIKTIAAYSLENESLEDYRRSLQGPYKATLKSIAYGNFWLSTAFSASTLVYALAYWWGAKQIIEGTYTQTQFFIVLPALLISAQFSGQLFSLAPDISKARVAAGNILDLLAIGPDDGRPEKHQNDIEANFGASETAKLALHRGMNVSFRDVCFSYPAHPNVQVLHGISISVQAGQFCALVGPSGSGKSTILALLERFYRPSAGSIFVEGQDITRTNDLSFRDNIALVPQSCTLFEGTVAFNISLGGRTGHEATQAEIEEACKLANIHDTITALPKGYSTLCGPHGSNFSGGQKQRLAIARALLRKPKLLLLDETTSALDAESERLLQVALEKTARHTTVVAVAHRLHTIQRADVIFMIEDGICVERGTHQELLERSEAYKSNVLRQTIDG